MPALATFVGEVGEHARRVVDLDDRDLALAGDGELRQGQRVLGSGGVWHEDVQLGALGRRRGTSPRRC